MTATSGKEGSLVTHTVGTLAVPLKRATFDIACRCVLKPVPCTFDVDADVGVSSRALSRAFAPVGMGVAFSCKSLRAYVCDYFFLRKSAEILVVDTLMYIGLLWRPFFVRAVRPCFCYSRKLLLCEKVKGAKGCC